MYEVFFDELKNLHDGRPALCQKIKSHGLPVIIFGASGMAYCVKNLLSDFNVKVEDFAVDAEYFKPNQTFLNLPIYNFAELRTHPEKYVFVLGMNSDWLDGNRSWKFMQDNGIIRYAFLNIDYKTIETDFIAQHREELEEVFSLFADDFSRQTLLAYLKAGLTWDPAELWSVFRRGVYFNELTASARGGCYVDCGAFRGDTIERFINWSGGRYKKIFAFEPDVSNFSALENFVRDKGYKNVTLFNCGVYDAKGVLSFESDDATYAALSRVSKVGNTSISVEKLDDIIGNEHIDLLKLSITGSEANALKGAVKLIESQTPVLAVNLSQSLYNLVAIAQFIKGRQLHDVYKIYLRKHSRFSMGEFVLYALSER